MLIMRRVLLSRTIRCVLLMAVAMLVIWPAKARVDSAVVQPPVCACCAEEGEWYERTDRVRSDQLVELNRMRFSPTANTYLGPSDSDDYEFATNYSLTQTRAGRRWLFKFSDDKGKTGTLSFTIPATLESFGVDLHDKEIGGLGPTLYKEMRFTGAAQVTGILKQGIAGVARFRLILQGRGNNCTQAEDFKNWTLQITGARASHKFYGSFKEPE
jgi:hypothetical protein